MSEEAELIRGRVKGRFDIAEERLRSIFDQALNPLLVELREMNDNIRLLAGKTIPQPQVNVYGTQAGVKLSPNTTQFIRSYSITLAAEDVNKPKPLFGFQVVNRFATIYALSTNTGVFYIGDSNVNPDSMPLAAGQSTDVYIDDLSKIWYIGTSAGDKLKVLAEWGVGQPT
jgi:hypothetical protein